MQLSTKSLGFLIGKRQNKATPLSHPPKNPKKQVRSLKCNFDHHLTVVSYNRETVLCSYAQILVIFAISLGIDL